MEVHPGMHPLSFVTSWVMHVSSAVQHKPTTTHKGARSSACHMVRAQAS